jgi:PPOX class probable F420-dependent enzyme
MAENKVPGQHPAPKASRPYMPDYGLLDAQSGHGLLPWSWATERLGSAQNYWIATTRPDGHPHMVPVWGIWLDDTFYFSTGRRSRKARNLAANPRCVVCPERSDEPVILEGVAEQITDSELLRQVADAISTKYQWNMEPTQAGVRDEYGNEGPVFAVHPRTAFGFSQDLTGSATRWLFDAE